MKLDRNTFPELWNDLCVDTVEEVNRKMLRHNFECRANVLNNPSKFPKANKEQIARLQDETQLFFTMYPD